MSFRYPFLIQAVGGVKRFTQRSDLFPLMDCLQQLCRRIGAPSGGHGYSTANYNFSPRKVVALGNVLLDHTAHLNNLDVLDRYKISMNTRGEMDVETLTSITTELIGSEDGDKCVPHLGGSALNTARILKKLGTEPLFLGAIGEDKQAEAVRELLTKEGFDESNYKLQYISNSFTGRCICLVHESSLALYANIGASSQFTIGFLKEMIDKDKFPLLRPAESKQIIYLEGFFVPQREEVITYIVRQFIQGRRYLALNLSANYIVKLNYHHILYLANHALFIFGNQDEFDTFRDCWGAKTMEDFAKGLMQESAVAKILLITKGADGVQLITNYVDERLPPGEITFQTFNAPKVDNVIDTTGCGDAFVAAFLHAWLEKRSLTECVRLASDVAAKVTVQIGCNLP